MAHVLLIEPDRPLAAIYEQALIAAGHTVDIRSTAQSAIFAADDHKPDIVLLELQLAAHSGVEFLYEFRTYQEWQDVPVIIASQVPAHELQLSNKLLKEQLGVAGYYYKPQLRLSDLLRLVNDTVTS
ncbi:MAG: Two component transcriptional regulator, winged helix [Candidatus Saccharibacteria bacterium]|nr:Two component transcriptional regulator, winged helix [Candidatus Saccharibacteria bacterium]